MDRNEVVETLWQRFAGDRGEIPAVDPVDHPALDRIRQEILTEKLPAFIPTSYKEGWYRFAHDEVYRLFMLHRGRLGRNKVRNFIPILTSLPTAGHHPWVAAQSHQVESATYSGRRMEVAIRQAIQLHAPSLVVFGGVSWADARRLAEQTVKATFEDIEGLASEESQTA